jgi:hypothetical protein
MTSTAPGSWANGTLNVFGGLAICTNNIVKTTATATSTGTVAVATGTLFAQGKVGSPAAPIDYLNVTNAILELNLDASGAIATNMVARTVNPGGTTIFSIANVIGVTGPTTFPLVAYGTLNGTVAGNFTASAPAGYTYSLVDNSAQQRIDLSISPSVGPTTNANITSVWLSGTNLVFSGTNNNGGQQFHYVILLSTNIALPLLNWTALSTNEFAPDGTFSVTNPIVPAIPQLFYDVKAVP